MYLQSISHATPPHSYLQSETLAILQASDGWHALKSRSRDLITKILTGDGGIERRYFAVDDTQHLLLSDGGVLNNLYEREAPALAGLALQQALDKAGIDAEMLDALFVCSCTGYLCPGISSHVAEKGNLRDDATLFDLQGLGCGAAIPTLRAAADYLASNPEATVAVVAVEVCSTAFFLNDDPGVLISLCLFADGAAATIWKGKPDPTTKVRCHSFQSLHQPQYREHIRFVNDSGKLKNQLDRAVPEIAAAAVLNLRNKALTQGLPVSHEVLSHTGGRDVIEAIKRVLPDQSLAITTQILADYGNMSSPSVLFALEVALESDPVAEYWLTAFGAGFSAYSCRVSAV
jgi:alkylresorcinol/alkylpyrone synthase